MKLLTKELRAQLVKQGAINNQRRDATGHTEDFRPVLKLFTPWTNCTWLLSEIVDEDEYDATAFGLCDVGMGTPELGYVSLSELQATRGPVGLRIERDLHWKPTAPLSAYATAARLKGRIVDQLDPLIGCKIKTLVPDMNDVDDVGEVKIPIGHTGTISANANTFDDFAVIWDDLDGKCAGWTIWERTELATQAEVITHA